jgi:hypothetical protein
MASRNGCIAGNGEYRRFRAGLRRDNGVAGRINLSKSGVAHGDISFEYN